jgi:hypothetical protein
MTPAWSRDACHTGMQVPDGLPRPVPGVQMVTIHGGGQVEDRPPTANARHGRNRDQGATQPSDEEHDEARDIVDAGRPGDQEQRGKQHEDKPRNEQRRPLTVQPAVRADAGAPGREPTPGQGAAFLRRLP